MKKIFLFISVIAMSVIVVACGTSNKNETPAGNQVNEESNNAESNTNTGSDGTEDNTDTDTDGANNNTGTNSAQQSGSASDDEVARMNALDYDEFSLEIDYDNHKEYEVELDQEDNNRVEAKIEDDINGVNKRGTEAFEILYPLVEQLTITQDTTKEEAIKEILDVFKQDENYQKFELEIKFKDGTKIEFEDMK